MPQKIKSFLNHYSTYLDHLDELITMVASHHQEKITCHEKCSSCCKNMKMSLIETTHMAFKFQDLSPARQALIKSKTEDTTDKTICPFLQHDSCLIYHLRPVSCRTEGLPILTRKDGKKVLRGCHLNFATEELTEDIVSIDYDQITEPLDTLNKIFIRETGWHDLANTEFNMGEVFTPEFLERVKNL